ncbi:ABC transporter substrate-binding protein [Streptomyces dioscori]|uniref:ABC transporter substrate-binding protein n=1 Tax=Streptomyces dioscori TaxID=2109333 RepID=A0A2P8Q025_9ACTN|nr:ABC transporter substrate-binding protein [Streptomyces dioscori]PSM39596.1 ABC transporter substrate-binding protein [Streptomyces dioscori]
MGWEFTDDRGVTVRLAGRPERVAAYVRAGAGLWDLGVRPVAVYGSGHDGDEPDRAKSGFLADVPYLGAGRTLDHATLGSVRPDLVVDVTYDGKQPYAVTEPAAGRAGAPVLALAVGADTSLPRILARFAELADALGGEPAGHGRELAAAQDAVRSAVRAEVPAKVLALSAAGPGQAHLARPRAWPELRHLAGLGVEFIEPGEGGANWATTPWERAVELAPDLVLADVRANAAPAAELESVPAWRALTSAATVAPWNPELPCSARAYADFIGSVAGALRELAAKER